MDLDFKPAVPLLAWTDAEKNLQIEIFKLYKILLNSAKIQEMRNLFNLSDDDFIDHFLRDEVIIKKFPAKMADEGRRFKTINGKDVGILYSDGLAIIQKTILDHFQLAYLPSKFVMHVIVFLPSLTERRRNERLIKNLINFYELGVDTKKLSFKSINTIRHFDEKFEFTKKYDDLKTASGEKAMDEDELKTLVEKAKPTLGKKISAYNIKNLRDQMDDFRKYFYDIPKTLYL